MYHYIYIVITKRYHIWSYSDIKWSLKCLRPYSDLYYNLYILLKCLRPSNSIRILLLSIEMPPMRQGSDPGGELWHNPQKSNLCFFSQQWFGCYKTWRCVPVHYWRDKTEGVLRREHCQIIQNLGNQVMVQWAGSPKCTKSQGSQKIDHESFRDLMLFVPLGRKDLPLLKLGRCDLGSRTLSKRTGKEVEKSGIPSTSVKNGRNLNWWVSRGEPEPIPFFSAWETHASC